MICEEKYENLSSAFHVMIERVFQCHMTHIAVYQMLNVEARAIFPAKNRTNLQTDKTCLTTRTFIAIGTKRTHKYYKKRLTYLI